MKMRLCYKCKCHELISTEAEWFTNSGISVIEETITLDGETTSRSSLMASRTFSMVWLPFIMFPLVTNLSITRQMPGLQRTGHISTLFVQILHFLHGQHGLVLPFGFPNASQLVVYDRWTDSQQASWANYNFVQFYSWHQCTTQRYCSFSWRDRSHLAVKRIRNMYSHYLLYVRPSQQGPIPVQNPRQMWADPIETWIWNLHSQFLC